MTLDNFEPPTIVTYVILGAHRPHIFMLDKPFQSFIFLFISPFLCSSFFIRPSHPPKVKSVLFSFFCLVLSLEVAPLGHVTFYNTYETYLS